METVALITLYLTMILLFMVICLILIAGFCFVVKRVAKRKKVNPRLMKWVEVLDWFKEDGNE